MKYNKTEIADIFGVAPNTISQWQRRGFPSVKNSGKNAQFIATDCIEWYLDYKRPPTTTDPTETAEYYDTQYRKYKAQLMEHKALREKGILITVEEAEENFTERLVQIREQLANIPLNWSPYLVGIENNKASQDKLQELLNDLMATLAGLKDPSYDISEDDDIEDEDIIDAEDIEDIK